jgi:hypothetical protein
MSAEPTVPEVLEVSDFTERLLELELDARTLQVDPRGETWLPADLRARVERDAACARELDEFVATELVLFDGREPSDAFFTKCVMQQLPAIDAVDDPRRNWILASAYALAIGVAYLLLGPWLGSGELGERLGEWVAWSETIAIEAGGAGLAIGLLVGAAALLVLPLGAGRRAADA